MYGYVRIAFYFEFCENVQQRKSVLKTKNHYCLIIWNITWTQNKIHEIEALIH